MDSDTAMNTGRTTNNNGNSDTLNWEGKEAVGVGEGDAVGEAVGDDGLEVGDVGLGLGEGVGLGANVAEMVVAPLTF